MESLFLFLKEVRFFLFFCIYYISFLPSFWTECPFFGLFIYLCDYMKYVI